MLICGRALWVYRKVGGGLDALAWPGRRQKTCFMKLGVHNHLNPCRERAFTFIQGPSSTRECPACSSPGPWGSEVFIVDHANGSDKASGETRARMGVSDLGHALWTIVSLIKFRSNAERRMFVLYMSSNGPSVTVPAWQLFAWERSDLITERLKNPQLRQLQKLPQICPPTQPHPSSHRPRDTPRPGPLSPWSPTQLEEACESRRRP